MKIEILYPEVCNLYGDLQNIEYLKRSAVASGVTDVEIIETSLKSEPYFANNQVDLIYLGTMTESAQELVINALKNYKERISSLIDEGQIFLVTGNALEIFGEYIECEEKENIECLGIFKTHAVQRMLERYNSLYVGKIFDVDVVGFKSQFTHSYGDFVGLFETVRGDGLNPGTKSEGIRKNNFLGTYIIGPLLVLNPLLTKKLLAMMGVENPVVAYEESAMDVYEHRLSEFMEPTRGLTY
ncbi:MAG: hypothetical protein MJ107_07915 [Lachnospiraceae bacterium]|nr:hypothetical protein [Lachnospiraceae bacterium]